MTKGPTPMAPGVGNVGSHSSSPEVEGDTRMSIDEKLFKDFFANWPAGVAVITCKGKDGQYKGFTASSFTALSLNPPLVLFCLYRKSGSFEHFEAAEGFGVSALRHDQQELSNRFAMPHPDRFAELKYTVGETGAPLLDDAWGKMECRTRFRYDGGDHVIFVGEIIFIELE